ncbi:unnamed protein product [Symbiodinium necroappetens]|uniref:Uncharacterized protein n=1 Tax=Symbiodinium necroappetens TaxID=1628268 RepID=A0A813BWE9_9DINO|nr:unnamed protein product [Symbiodinium necroappetens]
MLVRDSSLHPSAVGGALPSSRDGGKEPFEQRGRIACGNLFIMGPRCASFSRRASALEAIIATSRMGADDFVTSRILLRPSGVLPSWKVARALWARNVRMRTTRMRSVSIAASMWSRLTMRLRCPSRMPLMFWQSQSQQNSPTHRLLPAAATQEPQHRLAKTAISSRSQTHPEKRRLRAEEVSLTKRPLKILTYLTVAQFLTSPSGIHSFTFRSSLRAAAYVGLLPGPKGLQGQQKLKSGPIEAKLWRYGSHLSRILCRIAVSSHKGTVHDLGGHAGRIFWTTSRLEVPA